MCGQTDFLQTFIVYIFMQFILVKTEVFSLLFVSRECLQCNDSVKGKEAINNSLETIHSFYFFIVWVIHDYVIDDIVLIWSRNGAIKTKAFVKGLLEPKL